MGFRIDAGFHKQHQQLDVALLLRENNKKELKIEEIRGGINHDLFLNIFVISGEH